MYRLTKYFHFVFKVANMGRRKANIALLVILGAFILGGCPSKESSQPVVLKSGMPNTITLPNGEVVYDLNGEWDAVYEVAAPSSAGYDVMLSSKDIARITQEGNQFVGIKLIGDQWVGKNQEAVTGELEKNRFRKVHAVILVGGVAEWARSKGEISEDGNKIVIKARSVVGDIIKIVLKRK